MLAENPSKLSRHSAALAWATVVAVLLLVPTGGEQPPAWPWLDLLRPFADKAVHFGLFAVLGWLLVRGEAQGRGRRTGHALRRLWIAAAALATSWGLLLEVAQAFVPYRSFEALDGLADLLGAAVGAWWAGRRSGSS